MSKDKFDPPEFVSIANGDGTFSFDLKPMTDESRVWIKKQEELEKPICPHNKPKMYMPGAIGYIVCDECKRKL